MSKLYVAYGSNLNMQQMRYRCPKAQFVGVGTLKDYELQFRGSLHGAHATIEPKEGASVPVGVWMIQKSDEDRLDKYEGYRKKDYCYYNKERIPVRMDNGKTIIGMVYIMDRNMDFGIPAKSYYDTIRQGYQDCGFASAVLDQAVDQSITLAQQRMEQGGMRMW